MPLAATQLAQMIILATDTVMLGHFSKEALAAGALGNTVYFLVWLLGSGMPMAVSPVIAHVQGRHSAATKPRDRREVRIAVRMGLWSVALVSLPLLAALIFTRPILLFFHQEPRLAADAALFMSGLAWGLPFAMAFQVLRSFSTALSRAVPPLVVMVLAMLWNAGFDYALIFGHFGLPRLGLFGAGLASASSNIFSFVAMLAIVPVACRRLQRYRILHRWWQPHWASLAELFRLGLPIGITMVFEVALFNGAALAMGTFGLASLAAHQIAITIPSLTFMIPLGIGLAATVRVGLAAGAGDSDRGAARRLHRHRHGRDLHVRHGAAAAAVAAPDRQPVAARYPGQCRSAGAGGELPACRRRLPARGWNAGHRRDEPARPEGRARADVARGRLLLAGGRADVRHRWAFGTALKGFGVWLGLAFGLLVAAVTLTARFVLLSKKPL